MSDAIWIAFGSLAVTVASLGYTMRWHDREVAAADHGRRQQMVGEVIERLDRLVRTQSKPVWQRVWAHPELELTLAIQRLSLLVTTKIVIGTAIQLTSWYLGQQPIEWFRTQISHEPPPIRKRSFQVRNTAEVTGIVLGIVAEILLTLWVGGRWAQHQAKAADK